MIGALLALYLLPLWACGDAAFRPRSAWRTAGYRQVVWVAGTGPPVVVALTGASVGWFRVLVLGADVVAYAYMVKVRPLVRLAQGLHRDARGGPPEGGPDS